MGNRLYAGTVSTSIRLRIYKRDGRRCLRCGSTDDLTIDHIVPASRGGDDSDGNLQTLCHDCNQEKGVQCIDYRGGSDGEQVEPSAYHHERRKLHKQQQREYEKSGPPALTDRPFESLRNLLK